MNGVFHERRLPRTAANPLVRTGSHERANRKPANFSLTKSPASRSSNTHAMASVMLFDTGHGEIGRGKLFTRCYRISRAVTSCVADPGL